MYTHAAGAAGASDTPSPSRRPRAERKPRKPRKRRGGVTLKQLQHTAELRPDGAAVRSPWRRAYLSHHSRPGGLAPQLLRTLAALASHAALVGRSPVAPVHPGHEGLAALLGLSARSVACHLRKLEAAGCVELFQASRRRAGTRRAWTPHTWQVTARGAALALGRALPPEELAALAPGASRRPGRPRKAPPTVPQTAEVSSAPGRAVSLLGVETVSSSTGRNVLTPPTPQPSAGGQDGPATPGPSPARAAPSAAPSAPPATAAGFGAPPRTASGAFAPRAADPPAKTRRGRELQRLQRDRRAAGRRDPASAAFALVGATLRLTGGAPEPPPRWEARAGIAPPPASHAPPPAPPPPPGCAHVRGVQACADCRAAAVARIRAARAAALGDA